MQAMKNEAVPIYTCVAQVKQPTWRQLVLLVFYKEMPVLLAHINGPWPRNKLCRIELLALNGTYYRQQRESQILKRLNYTKLEALKGSAADDALLL